MDNLNPNQVYDPYADGIASGRDDMHLSFLGPPPKQPQVQNYRHKPRFVFSFSPFFSNFFFGRDIFIMPDHYTGRVDNLGETMEDYMFTAEWDWYTERILPWYRTDQIHFMWTEWDNLPAYMSRVPHLSASRVVTQNRTIRRASIVRRGIAAEFEHDFVATPTGRSSYMAALAQMARSVQETANVEVLRALLHCHRYQMTMWRKHNVIRHEDLDEYHRRKAERFMIAQKEKFGMNKIDEMVDNDQVKTLTSSFSFSYNKKKLFRSCMVERPTLGF
jgi:hypothetical protein